MKIAGIAATCDEAAVLTCTAMIPDRASERSDYSDICE